MLVAELENLDVAQPARPGTGPPSRDREIIRPNRRRSGRLMGNHAMLPLVESQLPNVQSEAALYVLVNGGGTVQSAEDMARAVQVAESA